MKLSLRHGAALAAAVVVAAGSVAAWLYRKPAPSAAPSIPQNKYADASVCADCHGEIAATYRKTGMGRSFAQLRPETSLPPGKTFHHKASDSYFVNIQKDDKYYQRRWQIGFDGKETNVEEKSIDYVIGSGNHSFTYLHWTSRGALQVLPLSWYSENGGYWDMSPGYDQPDYPGSVRPVHYECIFCHNAYPKIPESMQLGASPEMTFVEPLPEGIDCQRCHGPGQQHVDIASAGGTAEQIRTAIVNPKRLPGDREIEVCMQCHLETTSLDLPHSIRRFDHAPFSYVPGQPLGDFSIAFDRAGGMPPERFEIAMGAYRLRQSQCFLKSQGLKGEPSLRCTTCHNPHDIPHGPTATAHYNSVCQGCHDPQQLKAAPAMHSAGANCVGCHMPKRRTDDVVHAVMTDHLIRRFKPNGDPLALKQEIVESMANKYRGEVVAYYPQEAAKDALYLGVAQVRNQTNLNAGLPRLAGLIDSHPANASYYGELAQGYRAAGDFGRAIPLYEEAARRETTGYRLIQWGNTLMESGQFPQAETVLRRAANQSPEEPLAWGTLGWVLWQLNRGPEARTALERAVSLDPDLPELHNNLASVEWGLGDQNAAERQFREALRIQTGIAEWRLNLARVLATRGEIPEALYQFEQAIRLKPDFPQARFDYARLLAESGQIDAARTQLSIAANGSDAEVRKQALEVLQRLRR